MRFMVMVKATKDSEAGRMPSEELLAAMAKYNEELVKAGIMLDGNGLQPSSKGARVRFSGANRTVIDGPFAETKELVAGYWLWQCKSLAEAIEHHGFDSLWLSERISGPAPDPVLGLTFAAARTSRIKLGTSVQVLPGRSPARVAKAWATLATSPARLPGNRLMAGEPTKLATNVSRGLV